MVDTDQTLLERLITLEDQAAWKEFFDRYWPLIMGYSTGLGLARDQAENVLQETMVVLMRVLPRFKYDRTRGRFRGYLKTIVSRITYRAIAKAATKPDGVNIETVPEAYRTDPTPDAAAALENKDKDNRLWQESLFATAVKAVFDDTRTDVRTRQVFQAYAMESRPVGEVAAKFGLTPNAVYQIKNRVMGRIKAEIKRLHHEAGGMLE